jgi:hypothetical protein
MDRPITENREETAPKMAWMPGKKTNLLWLDAHAEFAISRCETGRFDEFSFGSLRHVSGGFNGEASRICIHFCYPLSWVFRMAAKCA